MSLVSLRYGIEPIRSAMAEAEPLIRAHIAALDPPLGHDIELDPEHGMHAAAEDAGMLLCFVARSESGEMAGYCTVTYAPSMHIAREIHANVDSVYMDPVWRRGMEGIRFLDWVTSEMMSRGVSQMWCMAPVGADFGKALERRSGWRMVQRVYTVRAEAQVKETDPRETDAGEPVMGGGSHGRR